MVGRNQVRDVGTLGFSRDPGVPGRNEDLFDELRLGELPRDRVLASSATDNQKPSHPFSTEWETKSEEMVTWAPGRVAAKLLRLLGAKNEEKSTPSLLFKDQRYTHTEQFTFGYWEKQT
jgi:hypothetical protein